MDRIVVEGYLNELTDLAKRFFCLEVNEVSFFKRFFDFRIRDTRLEVIDKSSGFLASLIYLEDIKQMDVS